MTFTTETYEHLIAEYMEDGMSYEEAEELVIEELSMEADALLDLIKEK